jgi:hypothetical protein
LDNGNEVVVNFQVPADAVFLDTLKIWFHVRVVAATYVPHANMAQKALTEKRFSASSFPCPNKLIIPFLGGFWNFFSAIQLEKNTTPVYTVSAVSPGIQAAVNQYLNTDNSYDSEGYYGGGMYRYPVYDWVSPRVYASADYLTITDCQKFVTTTYTDSTINPPIWLPMDIPFADLGLHKTLPSGTILTLRLTKNPSIQTIMGIFYNSENLSWDMDPAQVLTTNNGRGSYYANQNTITADFDLTSSRGVMIAGAVEEITNFTVRKEAPQIASGIPERSIYMDHVYLAHYDVQVPIARPDPAVFIANDYSLRIVDWTIVQTGSIPSEMILIPVASWLTEVVTVNDDGKEEVTERIGWQSILPGSASLDRMKINNTYVSDFSQTFGAWGVAENRSMTQELLLRDELYKFDGSRDLSMYTKYSPRRAQIDANNSSRPEFSTTSKMPWSSGESKQHGGYQAARNYNELLHRGSISCISPNVQAGPEQTTLSRTGALSLDVFVRLPATQLLNFDGAGYIPGLPHDVPFNLGQSTCYTNLVKFTVYVFQKRPMMIEAGPMGTQVNVTRLDMIASAAQVPVAPGGR